MKIFLSWSPEDEDRISDPWSKESWDERNGNYED